MLLIYWVTYPAPHTPTTPHTDTRAPVVSSLAIRQQLHASREFCDPASQQACDLCFFPFISQNSFKDYEVFLFV